MGKQRFNLPINMKRASKICLSSDGSWELNTDSDTSTLRTVVATDSVKVVEPIDAKLISPTATDEQDAEESVTDEESTDQQSSDLQSTDEQLPTGTVIHEESSPTVPVMDEDSPTVPVYETFHLQPRVRSSHTLLSFNDSCGKDICAQLDGSGATYKWPVHVEAVNLQQVRAANPGGDAGISKSMEFRCGAAANPKNMSADMKLEKRVTSADIKNRVGIVADRRKPMVPKTTFKNKNKLIQNVYMSQANKVSTKPATFLRRSSSYINRQAIQRETDRINYKMMRKLINVKAVVSTFR